MAEASEVRPLRSAGTDATRSPDSEAEGGRPLRSIATEDLLPQWTPAPVFPAFEKTIPAPPTPIPSRQRRLFTDKLMTEIQERHEEFFGHSSTTHLNLEFPDYTAFEFGHESRLYHGRYIYENERTQEFGTYLARRVVEYEADILLQSQSHLRPIYRIKREATKVEMQLTEDVGIKAQYSVAGHFIVLDVVNPWVTSYVTWEFTVSEISEILYTVKKPLPNNYSAELKVKQKDGIFALVGKKAFSSSLEGVLTASTYFEPTGTTERDRVLVTGINWIF